MKEIQDNFDAKSSFQLQDFLQTPFVLPDKSGDTNFSDYTYGLQQSNDWKVVRQPHKQRYLEYIGSGKDDNNGTSLLANLRNHLLTSPAFARYVHAITGLPTPTGWNAKTCWL